MFNNSLVKYIALSFIILTVCRAFGSVQISDINMVCFALAGFFFAIADFFSQAKKTKHIKMVVECLIYTAVFSFMVIPFSDGNTTKFLVSQWNLWLNDTVTLASLSLVFLILWKNELVRNKETEKALSERIAMAKDLDSINDSMRKMVEEELKKLQEEEIKKKSVS